MQENASIPHCTNPACGKPLRLRPEGTWERRAGGRCDTCHFRWLRAGRPQTAPAAASARANTSGLEAASAAKAERRRERVARAAELAAEGLAPARIAEALGVRRGTVYGYLMEGRRAPVAGGVHAPDVRMVNGRLTTPHERRVLTAMIVDERERGADVLAGLMRAG